MRGRASSFLVPTATLASAMLLPSPDLPITLFAGRCNPELAKGIAMESGHALGAVTLKNFSDGEVYVRYEESIRGTDVFIIQSTPPPADHWMELFLMVDAARRAVSFNKVALAQRGEGVLEALAAFFTCSLAGVANGACNCVVDLLLRESWCVLRKRSGTGERCESAQKAF